MHDQNIETLRDEALRLVNLEINILQRMLEEAGVLTEGIKGETQTFDRTTGKKHIEVLEGEQKKLDELEMVLAVVGTMKAGKSTTINAIVGTEVLPNRNRPMTALPTLIRHTRGKVVPVLKFENDQPIHRLMGELRKALKKKDNAETILDISNDRDMTAIITLIEGGDKFQTSYEGADAIFVFLRGLNDLVRLSRELAIEFPFSDYDEIHELPVIEVEFAHLRENAQTQGRLTLLDTPGPNESGQPHLRKMMREQLSKASAVLAILDFTQLNSEADDEVRKEISEIASVTEGRLYTLVNKFDEKDRNGNTAEEVKTLVSDSLMEGRIQSDNVFPVSAKWAYLANRARHELHVNKKLPDSVQHEWVADFGAEAFGRMWKSKIDDATEVKAGADSLWEASLFHAPLEKVIRTAHSRAAVIAVASTAAKLVDMAEKMQNLLNTRESALSKSASQLQDTIKALQKDINRIEKIEDAARKNGEAKLNELTKGTKQVFEAVKKDTAAALKVYFTEGKRLEETTHKRKEAEADQKKKKTHGLSGIFASFIGATNRDHIPSGSADFDPNSPVMKFEEREDATRLIKKIQDSISSIFDNAEKIMKEGMTEILEVFQSEFQSEVIAEAQKILSDMKNHLEKSGFEIELRIPSTSKLALNYNGAELLDDVIEEKSRSETRTRSQSGFTGSTKRFFGSLFGQDDWGYENYDVNVSYVEIDISKIQKAAVNSVDQAIAGLDKLVAAHIKKPLNDGINDFFAGFKESVEQIRGDLMQGIRDQEKSKAEQTELIHRLSELNKNVPGILTDSRELKNDVNSYSSGAA